MSTRAPPRTVADPGDRLGLALATTAASGLGLAIAVSRLAYEGGTNGLTVTATRCLVMVTGLFLVCRLTGRALRLPVRDHAHCVGLGMLMAMMFYGNVGSVQWISVGLAALLFYTFPPIVALIQVVVVGERVPAVKLLAIATAFAGLAVTLAGSISGSDPFGMSLALGAAFSAAWNSVWLMRRLAHHDALVLTFHMVTVASVVLIGATLALGGPRIPVSTGGWIGFALVVALQSASIPLYFIAIPRIGALKSAMISNVQPVVSIVAAFALYGELLTPTQLAGGALVLGAVWWMQRIDRRRQPT